MNTQPAYTTIAAAFPHYRSLHELILQDAVRANVDDDGAQKEALYTNGKDILFPVAVLETVAARLGISTNTTTEKSF